MKLNKLEVHKTEPNKGVLYCTFGSGQRTEKDTQQTRPDHNGISGLSMWVSDLQQHFSTVDAHRIHGAEGHEGDGDCRGRVHSVVVTERIG